MSPTDDSVRNEVLAVCQSPEFADSIARAILNRAETIRAEPRHDQDAWARSVLPLLKEYTTKLEGIIIMDPGAQHYLNSLQSAARNLAQFVSQRMSNTKDDVLRLELQLRLAEFEAALRQAGNPNLHRRLRIGEKQPKET